mmetsp:Transcript_16883/g.33600  ORF Transcript_16883/g.33600 Transcript_16883/m.33600 type:complete len:92 (-) Transcript_16883:887-1162(-)
MAMTAAAVPFQQCSPSFAFACYCWLKLDDLCRVLASGVVSDNVAGIDDVASFALVVVDAAGNGAAAFVAAFVPAAVAPDTSADVPAYQEAS